MLASTFRSLNYRLGTSLPCTPRVTRQSRTRDPTLVLFLSPSHLVFYKYEHPRCKAHQPLACQVSFTVGSTPLAHQVCNSWCSPITTGSTRLEFCRHPNRSPTQECFDCLTYVSAARIDSKALGMGAYGAFIAAPLSHYLMGILQKAFAGKTSSAAKIGMILANNLFIAPIQTA